MRSLAPTKSRTSTFQWIDVKVRNLCLSPQSQTWQDPASAIDPLAQFLRGSGPVAPFHAPPQGRGLQAPAAEVEGEVHDGREPPLSGGA